MDITIGCERVDNISVQGYKQLSVTLTNVNLKDDISVHTIIDHYGASNLLDAIGGLGDWLEDGNIHADEVAEWLADQGYTVERTNEEKSNVT